MKALKFDNDRTRASNSLQKIHADIIGQIKPQSFPGNMKYILVILDDFSRYAKTYYLQNKSEAGDGLESFIKHVSNIIGYNAKLCYVQKRRPKQTSHPHIHPSSMVLLNVSMKLSKIKLDRYS